MKCNNCGYEAPSYMFFDCGGCGAEAVWCPECGGLADGHDCDDHTTDNEETRVTEE